MTKAQVKAVEAAETETTNSEGETFTFAAIGQQRASLRVHLANGFSAVMQAVADKGEAESAVEETAQGPVIMAAQAIASGLLGKDDVSELLCEAFGRAEKSATAKSDKPSKTPAGYGLTIRKRAVCFSEAIAIKEGEIKPEAFPKWAQNKEAETIGDIVEAVLKGEKSASVGYRDLTEKERAPVPPLAFNPEKLAKLAEELAKPETGHKVQQSAALMAAYAALKLAIETLDTPIDF